MSHVPTLDEIRHEPDPVRKAVLEAMLRIIEERPLHVALGSVSVVALADEAQVKRHWLNQRHKDLRERFQFIAQNYIDPPQPVHEDERVAALEQQIRDLKESLASVTEERNNWKASAKIFVRAMNVQEVDLAHRDKVIVRLKRQLEEARGNGQIDEVSARRHRRPQPS